MSQEVACTVTVKPAPGKAERLKELLDTSIRRMVTEEPDTLQYEYYVSLEEGDPTIAIFERYASKDAMDRHGSTPEFEAMYQTIVDEELLAEVPERAIGSLVKCLRR